MSLPEELAGFSREELIELVGRLFGHIQVLEARIAELEGQQKPPPDAGKERKPPSWVKANRPARSKGERRKRPQGFARRRDEPTHRVEHATASCPDCQVPLIGGRVRGSRPGDYPAPGTGAGNRTRGARTRLPQVPEAVGARTGLGRLERGPPTVRRFGAE